MYVCTMPVVSALRARGQIPCVCVITQTLSDSYSGAFLAFHKSWEPLLKTMPNKLSLPVALS